MRNKEKRRDRSSLAFKLAVTAFLMFNVLRISAISAMSYESYKIVIEAQKEVPIIRGPPPPMPFEDANETRNAPTTEYEQATTSTADESDLDPNPTYYDYGNDYDGENSESRESTSSFLIVIGLVVVLAETVSSFIYTLIVIGHANKKVPIRRCLVSLLRLRTTWERLLWVTVIVLYSYIYEKFRADIYASSGLKKYYDTPIEIAVGWITVAEYAMLGIAESTIVLLTPTRIERAVSRAKAASSKIFGGIIVAAYLTFNAAFAIRNFSVCLYFALLAVYVTQNEQNEMQSTDIGTFTVIVVLQAMISIIRGNYGNLFLRLFLGYFCDEGESFSSYMSRMEDKDLVSDDNSDEMLPPEQKSKETRIG